MRISVVIPHLNQHEALARCLDSILAGQRQPDEIVVVDNGSRELPEAICTARPGVMLLVEPTPGPGPARNRGVTATTGEVLAFIDADCRADPAWLATAEAELADPAAEILGGDVRIDYADPSRITAIEAYESIYAYRMDRYIAREGFTGTGNLVVRRPVLEAVGPFAGLGVAEDRDWGRRATAAGHRIRYVAGMKVYHPSRESFADLARKWDRHSAHDYAEARQRLAGRLRFAGKALAMGISPLVEVPRLLFCDRVSGIGARAHAFAVLAGVRLYRTSTMVRLLLLGDPDTLSQRWNRDQSGSSKT